MRRLIGVLVVFALQTCLAAAEFIRGVGPRVEEPALALIPAFPYSAPYEDVRLKP